MGIKRDTRTLVLPIEQDEIYMTLLDVECLSLMMGWNMEMEKKAGGAFRSLCGSLEGEVVSLEPTERLIFEFCPAILRVHWKVKLTIFLEEIDDGTRIFFHSEGLPDSHAETWRELLSERLIQPLALFFSEED